MFAIWTEHIEPEFTVTTMVSSEIQQIKAGMKLISYSGGISHWYLHSTYDTFEEAYSVHSKLLIFNW